jgi:hypothetical protein
MGSTKKILICNATTLRQEGAGVKINHRHCEEQSDAAIHLRAVAVQFTPRRAGKGGP